MDGGNLFGHTLLSCTIYSTFLLFHSNGINKYNTTQTLYRKSIFVCLANSASIAIMNTLEELSSNATQCTLCERMVGQLIIGEIGSLQPGDSNSMNTHKTMRNISA